MSDPTMTAAETPMIAQVQTAMEEFQRQLAHLADCLDAGREDDAQQMLRDLLPHLGHFHRFCSSLQGDDPSAEVGQVMAEVEQHLQALDLCLEAHDMVALADLLRHQFAPCFRTAANLFGSAGADDRRPRLMPRECAYDEATFQANSLLLEGRMSELSMAALTGATPGAGRLQIIDGALWLSVDDDRRLLLQSLYDPEAEADRRVAAWMATQDVLRDMVVVPGLAPLAQLLVLGRALSAGVLLLLVAPNPADLRLLLGTALLKQLPESLRLICADNGERLGREFYEVLRLRPRFCGLIYQSAAWRRACQDEDRLLTERLTAQLRSEASNRCTVAAFSDEWLQNALQNLPHQLSNPGVDALKGAFHGLPAIVVAAGPSLDESLPILREVRDRCVLISVGTALKPLLAAGIRPHLVVQVDSDPVTRRQYDGAQVDGIYLLGVDSMHPPLLAGFAGRLFSYSATLRDYAAWLEHIGAAHGDLSIGGTVTLTAIDAAIVMGCDPIITVGLDLAMREDGTSHAAQSMYDGIRLLPTGLVRVPGNWQDSVPTTPQFRNYIEIMGYYFDDVLARGKVSICNATSSGAKLRGLQVIRPVGIPALLPEQPIDTESLLTRLHETGARPEPAPVLVAMRASLDELTAIARIARRASKCCRHRAPTRRQLEVLARCDRQIKRHEQTILLMGGAVRAACIDLVDQAAAAPDHLLEQSRVLYEQLAGAADWVHGLLEAAIHQYESESSQQERRCQI